MSYHQELLDTAIDLLNKEERLLTQADLRRSISTSYYALFHMFISEAIAHWDVASSRNALARTFDHGHMRRASNRVASPKDLPFKGEDTAVVEQLRRIGELFVDLQAKRHTADYDNGTSWTPSQAYEAHFDTVTAFASWQAIQHEKIAQDYLVSLLIKTRE